MSTLSRFSFSIPFENPFDFSLYSKIFNLKDYILPFRYESNCWGSVLELDSGESTPVTVVPSNIHPERDMIVTVFGDISTTDASEIRGIIRAVFCTDLTTCSEYYTRNSPIGPLVQKYKGLKPHLSQDPFQSIIKIIVRQLVSAEYAKLLITNLIIRFGRKFVQGTESFYAFPTPRTLAGAEKGDLLNCGLGYKWRYVRNISRLVCGGNLDFAELRRTTNEKVLAFLQSIDGIGQWSSQVFLFDGLHRTSVYPFFDITIQRALRMLNEPDRFSTGSAQGQWESLGLRSDVGFYATYLFAYFRQVRSSLVSSPSRT